jgi:ATP-binding cassette, sub-family E, member 1
MARRIAIVEKDKCNSKGCGEICTKKCPVNKTGAECIVLNTKEKAEINEILCTGCGICPNVCPYEALHILNLPEKLTQDPLFKFDKNSFELFSLPIVKEGKVVGVIGRNGIGKSTALKILANQLKPNLGDYKNPPSNQTLIKQNSNNWMGSYFTKLFENNIKVAYKPQRIEVLATHFKGVKVTELFSKLEDQKSVTELTEYLDMKNLLDSNIEDLSGGELQRVAIIAALAKEADVIYLDEPSSFLDITHRIKVAKAIRKYCEFKAVIVIEHDLATLDYISDEIQIFYGEQACYGVVSNTKSVRRGINEYLDGILADDNIRFRDYSIKFDRTASDRTVKEDPVFEYGALEKEFDKFKLKVKEGIVSKGEVLTIMGGNGLGKSTFLKMIAKELEPTKGTAPDYKVAYKPQYLDNNIENTVEGYLRENAGDNFESGWYRQQILEKLGLSNILANEIKTLSGGELQKLHIAVCLSKDSQVILMDEPSAFVDVEDRLKVAEVIKDFVIQREICAIVVDHDIQFIDYLGDSMLVFEGEASVSGHVFGPLKKVDGMNRILKNLDITYRKDKESSRPRINKPDSQLDKEQRSTGNYYME